MGVRGGRRTLGRKGAKNMERAHINTCILYIQKIIEKHMEKIKIDLMISIHEDVCT